MTPYNLRNNIFSDICNIFRHTYRFSKSTPNVAPCHQQLIAIFTNTIQLENISTTWTWVSISEEDVCVSITSKSVSVATTTRASLFVLKWEQLCGQFFKKSGFLITVSKERIQFTLKQNVSTYGLSRAAFGFNCFCWHIVAIATKHNNRLSYIVIYCVSVRLAHLQERSMDHMEQVTHIYQQLGSFTWTSTVDLRSVPRALFVLLWISPLSKRDRFA